MGAFSVDSKGRIKLVPIAILVNTSPPSFDTGTAAFVQEVSAAVTRAAFTFSPNPEVNPVPVTVNLCVPLVKINFSSSRACSLCVKNLNLC